MCTHTDIHLGMHVHVYIHAAHGKGVWGQTLAPSSSLGIHRRSLESPSLCGSGLAASLGTVNVPTSHISPCPQLGHFSQYTVCLPKVDLTSIQPPSQIPLLLYPGWKDLPQKSMDGHPKCQRVIHYRHSRGGGIRSVMVPGIFDC